MRNLEHSCDPYQHHVSFFFPFLLFISLFLNFVLMLDVISLSLHCLALFPFHINVPGKHFKLIIDWNTFVWYTSLFHFKGCTQYLYQWTSALPTMLQPLAILSDVQNMFKCRRLFKKCWLTLKMRLKLKKKNRQRNFLLNWFLLIENFLKSFY